MCVTDCFFNTLRSRRLEVVGARSFVGPATQASYFIVNVLDLHLLHLEQYIAKYVSMLNKC